MTRVQHEIGTTLEAVRKKQDADVQDLLYFLRRSNISADPFHSWDSAKVFVDKLGFPAFLMSPAMGILKANESMTNVLGYEKGEIDGWPAARINIVSLMSEVGAKTSQSQYHEMKTLQLKYVYLSKSREHVRGVLAVTKIIDGAYMMVFHPDVESIVTDAQLDDLLSSHPKST